MNDPEASRCLEKAQAASTKGDWATAARLAMKAKRMFSPDNFKGIAAADQIINHGDNPKPKASATASSQQHARQRRGVSTSVDDNRTDSNAGDYNPEQEAKCHAILQAKDYYKILKVDKNCSSEEVKKAYRKLALQFHPDKAKCPSAEAAFKELSRAYQCLSDPDARRHYDTHGTEENAPQQYRQNYESHFMSPELEIQIELSHFSSLCTSEQSRILQQLSALKFYGTPEQYRRKSDVSPRDS
ncbi:dnaJ homolog subfamily B member 1-like [Condylostylus longicornis]|uniref:dnaJ homolog subfamily B member 1-like n=1 Tax=Condylostylus longicornis TaxID=2530218 RepID=UPI00244DC961|nr:dnaJ homolog subfamily B member 1-like [Condylostylus longicornis]